MMKNHDDHTQNISLNCNHYFSPNILVKTKQTDKRKNRVKNKTNSNIFFGFKSNFM